jgi:hypothetical protein
MALTDRDIIITPNRGAAVEPKIAFTGADSVSSGTITLKVLNSGTTGILSFEGNSGQLLSIADTMSGTIFSANDISGIPSIEVLDTGMVKLAQYNGTVVIGTGTNATGKLQIYGNTWSNSTGGDLVVRNPNSVGAAITMMPTNSASFSAGWSLYAGASGAAIGDGAVGLWNHTASAARLYVNQAGNLTVTGSVSGTQFYDSTNSAFYLFPTGNSRLRGISSLGSELASGHDPYGLVSVTRGTADNYAYFGLTRSGAIGMGIGIDTSNNLWFGGTTGGHNGTRNSTYFYSDVSGNVYANTSFRAPVFYDSASPTYYGDFGSTTNQYQAISFGDSTRYSAVSTTINGAGAGDKLILYGGASNYDARVLVGADYDFIFKSQGQPASKGNFKFYSGTGAALALTIDTDQTTISSTAMKSPIYYDTNTAYYFNGDGTTNLLNLTVNGTLSVSNFSSNLISLGAQRQYYLGKLAADGTQAKRYEVARLFVDIANWHDAGVMLVELQNGSFVGGDYQVWSVNYDYSGATGQPTCRLIQGDSPRGRYAQVTTGTPVQISGNYYYISVYVDVRYYSSYYTFVKTTQTSNSSATAANSGASWVFTTPASSNISDFSPSTTVTTNNTLQSTADMRAPIFYDNDNTGYYIDPNSTSNFNEVQFQNGKWYTTNNSSGNSTNMYIRPDGNNTYVWRMIFGGSGTGHGTGVGGWGIYNDTLAGDYSAIFPYGGFAVFPYSVRSPIYYDYTDTSYFVDPNSNSYVNFLRSAGNMQANGGAIAIPTSYKNVPGVTPGTTGDWKRGSSNLIMAGSQNTDGSGWSYGSRLVNLDYGDGLGMSVDVNYNNGWTNDALFVSGRSGRIGNIGINQTAPAEKLDIVGRLKVSSAANGYGWIYSTDTNHSIIVRGDRDGTVANYTNYYQFGGTHANALGHRFWTGGALASQTEKFRISDNVTASFQQIYAPSLYDINDTGYYLDPNGTSNLFRGYFAQLMKRNNRFSNGDRYPLGHYSDGDMVWNIDPSWSEYELQEYFGSSNVTWVADSTAPGGYAIQVAGGTNVFTNGSGSGFPMIPIDSADDVFYMEIWIKGISGTANHYMGSVDFNESFGSLGGNPGSYGYWVLVGNVPGTSWSKWYGYIGGFGTDYGTFKVGAKYWSPQALFNYSGGTSYISGWKVLRVNRQTSMIINTPNGSSSTGALNSRGQTLTIKRSNTSQLNLGSYPGAWTSAIQIQDNNATNWLWMSPLTGNTPTIATNYGAINYYTTAQNGGFAGSMNNGSFRSPIFYDSDNTAYYLDPNADLSLRVYGEISNSNYAEGNLQPGALNIGRTDLNYSWGGSWSSNVLVGILANCADNWEFAIHDSGSRVVSPFLFVGGSSYYLEMGRDIGWGTMPILATNSFRAPIFYDSNDTSYYLDPNSTSYLRSLFLGAHDSGTSEFRFGEDSSGWYGDRWYWDSGYNVYRYSRFAGTDTLIHYHDTRDGSRITYGRNIVFDDFGKGIVGNYDSTRLQAVFAMGDSYKMSVNGAATNNMYGVAWSHPNAGGLGGANNLNDHGLLIINNGSFRAAISSRAVFSADVRGTLFYDYNDTGYYCDPNSESNLFKPTYYAQQNWSVSYRAVGRSRITSDQNHWTNTVGWGTDYGNWSNYWKYGAGFFEAWGTSTDHPQGSGYIHAQGIQSGLHYATSDGGNAYGWQMVGAHAATDNRYWARGKWAGSISGWKEFAMYGGNIASSLYASIYYDADNTAFYVDPASTSNIGRLLATWSGQQGHIIRRTDNPGTNGVTLLVQNDFGNNSWGIVSEFRVNGTGDAPSILFSQATNANTWSAGFGYADTGLFRINYDHGYRNGSWGTTAFYIDRSSNTFSNGSSRAPIFYDLNDTGYYMDPNSTSDSALRMRGGALFGPNVSWGKYLYVGGNGRVGTTASVAVTNGNLHLDCENGYAIYLNNYSGNGVFSTTIYDINNSAYFLDPNGRSRLSSIDYGDGGYYFAGGDWGYRHNTPYGWIQFGPANTGHAHIYTDRSNFYFNVYDLYTNGRWVITENYTQNGKYLGSDGSIRANIFYDQADTGYYLDANADRSSNINGVNATTQAKLGITYKYNNWRPYITGDTNYWVGSMGWSTTDLGDIFMWGSGFWDSWSSPGNAPSGTSHWTGLTSQHYNQGSYGYGWQLTMGAGDPGLFYVRGMWGVKNNTWYKVAIYDYNSNAARPFYASIYYDANDTGYYADPNSTSVFYRLNINNNVYFTNYGRGIVGTYASTRYQAVFSMGDAYKLPDGGENTGSLYGLAWSHPNAGGVAGNLNTHGLLAMENGSWLASLTGSTRARDDMRAPIFYDNNNTGYYFNGDGTTNANVMQTYSYQGNGNVGGTGAASWHPSGIYSAGYNWLYGGGNAGGNNWTNFARIDSNIYYDYNNTAYYVDPASGTYLYGGIWNNGGHGDSRIMNRLLSGNNGAGTGEVRLQMWCSEPGVTWDWAGFGYNVMNDGGTNGFGRPNANFGQAYMRMGTGGQWYFYTASTGGTRYTHMYLAPNNGIETYGILYNDTSMRAPIFYDSNNTAFYNDPASTSRLSTLVVTGDITVGSGASSSNIYMGDSDEGQRRIHCNSNRIGFLSQADAWGSYCGDGGEWYSDQSVRSPIFYDNNNTGYYCDPNGYSQFSSGEFNSYARVARLSFTGEGGDSGQGNNAYSIYQVGGAWSNPFPDLGIGFHTGIRLGAYFGYNGTRIYNNHDWATQIASFGDGDNNFRSYYNIIAYASDERLKENIVNIPDALEKVQQLNGVTFDWKEMVTELGFEPQAWHEVGVLAQQVEAVLPEAVEIAPFDYDWKKPGQSISGEKYLTVKYEKIVPLLIEAIKDQQKIIMDQEDRISRLESLIEKFNLGK